MSKSRPGVELDGATVELLLELYDKVGSYRKVASRMGVSDATVKKYVEMREMDRRGGARLDREIRGLSGETDVEFNAEVYDMARDRVLEGRVGNMVGLEEGELVKALPTMLPVWEEEMFCRNYVRSETMANGVEAYLKAYGLTGDSVSRDRAKVGAYKLLQERRILKRIHDLLDLSGLNMEFVSRELVFLIAQSADLRVKVRAIEVATKLLTRTEKGSKESAMVMNQQLNVFLGISGNESGKRLKGE